jgi:hypothetical protein
VVVIEASTNLTDWAPLTTNSVLASPFRFRDWPATNFLTRFYRARLP